jgi:hypothetical protein
MPFLSIIIDRGMNDKKIDIVIIGTIVALVAIFIIILLFVVIY